MLARRYSTKMAIVLVLVLGVVGLPAFAGWAGEGSEASEKSEEPEVDAAAHFARANRLATAGAITRSIPHYKKVLNADAAQYPQAYFNLAEVYRLKEECDNAVLLYSAYLAVEQEAGSRSDAKRGIRRCSWGIELGTLKATIKPDQVAQVRVEGFPVALSGITEGIELRPGSYQIEVGAPDHLPDTQKVDVEQAKTAKVEFDLENRLLFGKAHIKVDQKGATIKLEPKKLDSPKGSEETIVLSSPMEEPKKLATGKYFLEVTKEDYDRWIRNIYITKGNVTTVDVSMSEALPEAIRPD